jgi:membrane-bound lytic murein transglycosylase MltF
VRKSFIAGILAIAAGGCTQPPEPAPANATPAAPSLIEIRPAADQAIDDREKLGEIAMPDLDAIVERGYLRILVAPSGTFFETVAGRHHGVAVDAGVALARELSIGTAREVSAVFIETREDQLVASLLAGKGDVAANVLQTFARDEQVAFAPPIKAGIREVVVTESTAPLVSLEDVGGRTIHVRTNSDHHASLIRLNEQLRKINRRPAKIVAENRVKTDEGLLGRVNDGSVPATIVDDYVLDLWQADFPKIVANRDVAVSQDGVLAWVTRKDAPKLTAALKAFFSTHTLKMRR